MLTITNEQGIDHEVTGHAGHPSLRPPAPPPPITPPGGTVLANALIRVRYARLGVSTGAGESPAEWESYLP